MPARLIVRDRSLVPGAEAAPDLGRGHPTQRRLPLVDPGGHARTRTCRRSRPRSTPWWPRSRFDDLPAAARRPRPRRSARPGDQFGGSVDAPIPGAPLPLVCAEDARDRSRRRSMTGRLGRLGGAVEEHARRRSRRTTCACGRSIIEVAWAAGPGYAAGRWARQISFDPRGFRPPGDRPCAGHRRTPGVPRGSEHGGPTDRGRDVRGRGSRPVRRYRCRHRVL